MTQSDTAAPEAPEPETANDVQPPSTTNGSSFSDKTRQWWASTGKTTRILLAVFAGIAVLAIVTTIIGFAVAANNARASASWKTEYEQATLHARAVDHELDEAKEDNDDLKEQLSDYADDASKVKLAEQAVEKREAEVAAREEAVGIAEAAKKANEFGNGTHLVGTGIQPGTYQNTGSSSCYWERLSGTSGEFGDIIANDLPSGVAVVTIKASDVAFKSQGCGTWTKIG